MKPERWRQIEQLYDAALKLDLSRRAAFLDEACAGDEGLRREVVSLLRSDGRAGSFLAAPAVEVAAKGLAVEGAASPVGRQIGPYQVLALLGAGGMGEVYLAKDTRLDRQVALKLLPAIFAQDSDRLRRFEREARAASALNHPNILTVYDIGTNQGLPYMVTELLEGEELRAQLPPQPEAGALSVRQALGYAQQVAQGLAAAHEKGIVHRDLKPENLFITSDGRLKILDFGLAKLRAPRGGPLNSQDATQTKLTGPGTIMGTVGYMAPEQVRGEETDARADLFSFGVILYEMLSGRRPFRGESSVEVMNAILKDEPPELGEANAKISPQLERIVRRCLEKQPGRRFQSAGDLGFALEALAMPSGPGPEKTPALPTVTGKQRGLGNQRLAWIVAAMSLLGLLATLGLTWAYLTRLPAPDARVMKSSILPPEKSSFLYTAVSPDGRWLAFTAATGGKVQLWVRALDSTEAQAHAGTEGASYPFWSPDSRFIGFFAGSKLKKIERSGGIPATLCDVGIGTGGTWNRDGVILFSALGGGGLSRVSAAGGEVTSVKAPDLKRLESDFYAPCFLPDGRHFLYSKFAGPKEARGIYLGALDSEKDQRLLGDSSNAVYAASGSGAGYLLFGREEALLAQPFDAERQQFGGEPTPIAGVVGRIVGGTTMSRQQNFSASANGVLVFSPHSSLQQNQLVWVDRAGRKIRSLEGAGNIMLRLSPDGQRVVVARFDTQQNAADLWLSDAAGGMVTRFTFDPASDQFPIWSPDGSRIVWASNREGLHHLYEKAATGLGQDAVLLESDYFKFPTDWSRDGRYIIYRQIDPRTKYDLWVLPLFGERQPFPFLQTTANEAAGVLSPDGRWLAYAADDSGRYEVYVQNFPQGGGKRQVSTGGGLGPHWRRNGKELYYQAPDGKLMAAEVKGGANFESGAPAALFEFRAGGYIITPYYDVTKDGQKFLLSTIVETEAATPLTVVVNWAAEAQRSP